ncbi:MAG: CoA transferase subunit A [Actinobacteria bacterium]|nr:CoA transferase subunit A [Actinomycetota bacterium]
MGASKVVSISDAVSSIVEDGSFVVVGGMHLHNNPMALVREIIRQGRRTGKLLTSPCGAMNADLLLGAGLVDELITSYVGFEHLGLAPNFRRLAEQGSIRILECDEPYIAHGLYAGAGGLPFIPLPRGLEYSDIPKVNPESYTYTEDPFSGERVLVGAPLLPEVALLHAQLSDAQGNAVLLGAHFLDRLIALASKHVILQVERIVSTEEISSHPMGTTIPAFLVDAVVVATGGCHPTSSHAFYTYDEQHLRQYLEMARDERGTDEYLTRYVRQTTEALYQQSMADRIDSLRNEAVLEQRAL